MPPRAYADVVGNFRRAQAGAYAGAGDYERAARTDPEQARGYLDMGDEALVRRERADARSANTAYAGALNKGDYEAAGNIAAKAGDVEGVTGAHSLQAQHSQEQRLAAYRALAPYAAQFSELGQMQDEAARDQAYAAWRESAAQAAAQDPQLSRFVASMPQRWSPGLQRQINAQLDGALRSLLSPEELATLGVNERRLDVQDRNADIAERRASAAERTAEAAMLRAERSGNQGQGASGLTPRQIQTEREFARDWRGVYNNFAEIRDSQQRIESVANLHNSAGDLALVVAFTKMLDPGSVAREGEVALTQSAASALSQAANYFPRLSQGNTLLPDQVRAQLVGAAREMYGNYQRAYGRLAEDYGRSADEYGFSRERTMMGFRESDTNVASAPPQRPPGVPADYIWNAQDSTWDPPN
jgi:hypothetical protein